MLCQTTAYVSLENIEHNILEIRKNLKSSTKIMAAVKGDAYGHGVVAVANRLSKIGVNSFAVACLDEALQLRNILPQSEILILGFTHPSLSLVLSKNRIIQAVYGMDFAQALSQSCSKNSVEVETHLAFDTGMGRIGFTEAQSAIEAAQFDGIKVTGAFTHFSCADMTDAQSDAFTRTQFENFIKITDEVRAAGVNIETRHCANSAAIFRFPEFQLDMVRAGITMYGLAPNTDDADTYKELKPAMQLKTMISHIKMVEAGTKIGYGAAYTAPKRMRIATVPCGYADGYHRSLGTGYVLVCGKRAKIVGRVCMDQMMIDVSDIPEANFLSPVTLFGTSGEETLSVDELARLSDTINYQLICDVSKRVIRVYE